jgi:integrase
VRGGDGAYAPTELTLVLDGDLSALAPMIDARAGARSATETGWKRAKLEPIRLHECRHTFASLIIAAGVNAKALSTYMGHSSITGRLTATGT